MLSGGGKAPVSGGSVRRAGASLATVTGRQSGAVDAAPFTMRRMSRSARSSRSLRPSIPVSASTAERASSSASWRAPQPFERKVRALRLARRRHPVPELPAERLAVALQAVARQHGGPRPAGHDEGLRSNERREPARPLGQQVVEVEPEPAGLPPHGLGMRLGDASGLVGRALEDDVERMAGMGEGGC